jgi:hypothetical protein
MRKTLLAMAAMLLLAVSCDQSHLKQARVTMQAGENELDREIRQLMEKGTALEERRHQVPAIQAAFERRTRPDRARWLAALCYFKTLGTPFMPIDLAEIALTETGGHRLSSRSTSYKGALGVWQLMPKRAMSHGYSPNDMKDDEKCAEAAVKELMVKMDMARGNLTRAKKLYCGVGPDADQYEVKRRQFRREIFDTINQFQREASRGPAKEGTRS